MPEHFPCVGRLSPLARFGCFVFDFVVSGFVILDFCVEASGVDSRQRYGNS